MDDIKEIKSLVDAATTEFKSSGESELGAAWMALYSSKYIWKPSDQEKQTLTCSIFDRFIKDKFIEQFMDVSEEMYQDRIRKSNLDLVLERNSITTLAKFICRDRCMTYSLGQVSVLIIGVESMEAMLLLICEINEYTGKEIVYDA